MTELIFDLETTGLDTKKSGIITIAYTVVVNCERMLSRELRLNPISYGKTHMSKQALDMNGVTIEDLKQLPNAGKILDVFLSDMRHYVTKGEKIKLIGFNASSFDKPLLQEWVDTIYPNTFWKLFDHKVVDVFELTKWFQHLGIVDTGMSQSLSAITTYFNMEHTPHNATSDVTVTYQLYKLYKEALHGVLIPV